MLQRSLIIPPNSTIPFWHAGSHHKILSLALPMILANITTPLLGLVDTAVLGHMPATHYLAGAAIGALILTQIYWVCGFLRMSATGLSAQARGQQDDYTGVRVLLQSSVIGVLLGCMLLLIQQPVLHAGLWLADSEPQVSQSISDYYSVRVWGAPAAMANLALIGWLVGQQLTRVVMLLQIVANLLNAALDLLFVFGFGWGVEGVAAASVIAEVSICVSGYWLAWRRMPPTLRARIRHARPIAGWLKYDSLKTILAINNDMLLRNLALQLCLAFLAFQGARLGEVTAATNAILMQFFVLIALGLDGIAFAIEALVGEAKGAGKSAQIRLVTWRGLFWSSLFAVVYSATFVIAGENIITLLTDKPEVINYAVSLLPVTWLLPLFGHWCFLYDGVYVGLTRSRAMRDSMLISALLVYLPTWWLLQQHGNLALWLALLAFLLARGLSLGGHFYYLARAQKLLD